MENIKIINNGNYYDDNGDKISKEEFENKYLVFEKYVDNKYEELVSKIVNKINELGLSNKEKLWILFDYFTRVNMIFNDSAGYDIRGENANAVLYSIEPYKNWKINHNTKYPAILNNSGVCITFSLAFEDIANRLGIPCRSIGYNGQNGRVGHEWNIVYIDNEFKHIDIGLYLQNRKSNQHLDKKPYFLIDNRSMNFEFDLETLKQEMMEQYRKLNDNTRLKIEIKNRTDIPKIRYIIKPKNIDSSKESHITIHKK